MSNARKVFAVALLVALAWAVAPVSEAQPPIRIGATLSQTGVNATVGQALLRGYRLCVEPTNDKDGVLGRTLELIIYDDQSDPATAVRLYEKLIAQDKVDLVLGPYGAPITDAVADVTERRNMPLVAPAGNVTAIYRKGRKFIFSLIPPTETASLPLTGPYAAQGQTQHQGYQRCVKHTNDKGGVLGGRSSCLSATTGRTLPRPSGSTNSLFHRARRSGPTLQSPHASPIGSTPLLEPGAATPTLPRSTCSARGPEAAEGRGRTSISPWFFARTSTLPPAGESASTFSATRASPWERTRSISSSSRMLRRHWARVDREHRGVRSGDRALARGERRPLTPEDTLRLVSCLFGGGVDDLRRRQ